MKKNVLSFGFILTCFLFFFLTSCTPNTTYSENKKVLDNNYPHNPHYGILTLREYKDENKEIDFEEIIRNRMSKDGKGVEIFYRTEYRHTLVNDTVYFCFTYGRGRYALGYVDLHTLDVYLDYLDYADNEVRRILYNFSTDKFVCFTFISDESEKKTDVVFFKDTNQVEFDYDISKLVFEQTDVEIPNLKDYYTEDGIKYTFVDYGRSLMNTQDGSIIKLPSGNELADIPVLMEMYEQFSYDGRSLYAKYFSIGEELFFYIEDRPRNSLNVPFLLFKCNIDFSEVEYIGYCESLIVDVYLK